jgi:hypothetical protein
MAQGCNVGPSANAPAADDTLTFLGQIHGSNINLGVLSLQQRIDLFVAELKGKASQLRANIQAALGLQLPDPSATVTGGLSAVARLGITGIVANLTAQLSLPSIVAKIQAKLNLLLTLKAQLSAQLSAGGLVCWRYSGTAQGLGEALAAATVSGIPGGSGPKASAYGLVIASTPATMQTFGTVFLT